MNKSQVSRLVSEFNVVVTEMSLYTRHAIGFGLVNGCNSQVYCNALTIQGQVRFIVENTIARAIWDQVARAMYCNRNHKYVECCGEVLRVLR